MSSPFGLTLLKELPILSRDGAHAFYDQAELFVQRKECPVYLDTNQNHSWPGSVASSDRSDMLEQAIRDSMRPEKRKCDQQVITTRQSKRSAVLVPPAVEVGSLAPRWLSFAEKQCRVTLRHCDGGTTARRKVMAESCSRWKITQLQEFCRLAGMAKSGTKGELVLRVSRYLRPPLDLDE